MTHDLDVSFPRSVSRAEFNRFVLERGRFQPNDPDFVYINPLTGVYFKLIPTWKRRLLRSDRVAAMRLEVNLFRPDFWGAEAAREIDLLIRQFGGRTSGPGGWSPDAFLRDWKQENAQEIRARLAEDPAPVPTLPAAELQRIWDWNYSADRRRRTPGQTLHVPTIFLARLDEDAENRVRVMSFWAEGAGSVLPRVDFVLALKRLPGKAGAKGQKTAMIPWAEMVALAQKAGFAERDGQLVLDYAAMPAVIADHLAGLSWSEDGGFATLSPHEVLDAENLPAPQDALT